MLRSLNWRTLKADCSMILDTGWQQKVKWETPNLIVIHKNLLFTYVPLTSFTSLQIQRRVPLSCRRSKRSCLRSWGRWRKETCWCLNLRSRGWRRGPRTETWRVSCCPKATNSTGPRRMTAGAHKQQERGFDVDQWCGAEWTGESRKALNGAILKSKGQLLPY